MKFPATASDRSYTCRLLPLVALAVGAGMAGMVGTVGCSSDSTNGIFSGDDGGGGSAPTGNGGGATGGSSGSGGGSSTGGSSGGSCVACVSDRNCGSGVCAQIAGESYCGALCPKGNECATGEACVTLSTVEGAQVNACVARGGVCGTGTNSGDAGAGSSSGGTGSSSGAGADSGGGGNCGTLAAPGTTAPCNSCASSSSKCQANGCYGGWYCDTATSKCQAPPTTCTSGGSSGGGSSGGGSGSGGSIDAGAPPTGTVGTTGGSVSRLYFAVVGDTRPANVDDTAGYPTAIATKIYQDMEGFSPRPSFGVSTGDYMFATPGSGNAAPQLSLYASARGNFSNVMFPAMGNHECTGYTASNCGSGNADGVTENYTAFLGMLQPLGQTNPYYAINVNDTAGTWTAKFVFIAANAWTSAQSSWLDSTLAQPTTYTFVVRHEPAAANTAPGVSPSEQIMAKYPYTLSIVGHSHTYNKSGAKEVIVGNGGAPLTGGVNYGFGLLQQRSDQAIQVDMIDYSSLQPNTSFRFAVNPDGSPAP